MADSLGSVKNIAELALKIKQAVETVRQNKQECLQIRKRVVRVSSILSQLEDTVITRNNPAMAAALEELDETLRHAHTLIAACQEKNIVCLFCAATTLSNKLRRVKDDISDQMMEGMFATSVHVTIVLKRIQDDVDYARPPRVPIKGWPLMI
uniref:Mixed lineage kinase domain-containing protein n=1 Tax=Oryza punctata TaxID=4537 RepID=A0A0E0ML22_ORYPU